MHICHLILQRLTFRGVVLRHVNPVIVFFLCTGGQLLLRVSAVVKVFTFGFGFLSIDSKTSSGAS